MRISQKGLDLLKHYEGCKLKAYQDSKGIWTIGYGNTYYPDSKRVQPNHEISKQYAEELLDITLHKFELAVSGALRVKINQTQFDALICLCYNIGISNFIQSSLIEKINSQDPLASNGFLLWNKARIKGVLTVLNGLTFRRQSEKYLYDKGEVKFFN